MQFRKWALALTALGALSACGDTLGEQALLGAGAGAGTAMVLEGDAATGAVVGAAANVVYCRTYPGRC